MTGALSSDQIADLAEIQQICVEMGANLVVIGATALLIHGYLTRFTRDVDLTVTLDLGQFETLANRLATAQWKRAPKLEHRWTAPRGTLVDLIPAGSELRRRGVLVWPISEFQMSLAGFGHVFTHAVEVQMPGGLNLRVIPPAISALLKIHAYVEDPYRRVKDLHDIKVIFGRYERDTDRMFSDAIFDAQLPDLEFANAFLLGLDLREFATAEDAESLGQFLARVLSDEEEPFTEDDYLAKTFRGQLQALRKGFTGR